MRKSNVTEQIRVTEETYNYINNSNSDVYKIGDKVDLLLGLITSMPDAKPKKKYADKPHMNIKGIIEAQILNCFSPKVSFDAKPKVVKEEFGKKMEEEIRNSLEQMLLKSQQMRLLFLDLKSSMQFTRCGIKVAT